MFLESVGPEQIQRTPALVDEIDALLMAAYQTASRRDRFLRWLAIQPDGWVVARPAPGPDSPVVGCGGFIAYPDAGFGWVGLIAALPSAGRQGVGRLVTQWCVDQLRARGCAAALDGSGQGAPLYARMGFVDHGYSAVYQHDGSHPVLSHSGAVSITKTHAGDDLSDVYRFDAARFGADRSRLLDVLRSRYGDNRFLAARANGDVVGFVCAQDDSIGPLVADSAAIASELLNRALVLPWNAPPTLRPGPELQHDANTTVAFLQDHGFSLVRALRRQHLGIDVLPGQRTSLWAMASFGEG